MPDVAADLVDIDPDQRCRCAPPILERDLEDDLPGGRDAEPGVGRYLPLKLPGTPAGVTESYQGVARAFSGRHGFQNIP